MELSELASIVDRYLVIRNQRIHADKEAKRLKGEETKLEEQILYDMNLNGVRSVGASARVTMQTKEKPIVEDWDAFYEFVRENDAFELLHKRVTEAAIKEREWEVPGVGKYEVNKLTVSKI